MHAIGTPMQKKSTWQPRWHRGWRSIPHSLDTMVSIISIISRLRWDHGFPLHRHAQFPSSRPRHVWPSKLPLHSAHTRVAQRTMRVSDSSAAASHAIELLVKNWSTSSPCDVSVFMVTCVYVCVGVCWSVLECGWSVVGVWLFVMCIYSIPYTLLVIYHWN